MTKLRFRKAAGLWVSLVALGPIWGSAAMTRHAPPVPRLVPKPLAQDQLQVTVHRLENGLTVYLSPNHQAPRVSAWIAVRAGGKHDPANSTGMAHYLEHMLFKGSRDLGTLDYKKEKVHLDKIKSLYEELFIAEDNLQRTAIYEKIDAQNVLAGKYGIANEMDKAYRQMGFKGVNAFTGDEYTVYICDFPANRAEHWAKLESNRFLHPVFRLFQTEIETVYEEKNRSMDNAERLLGEALNRLLYKKHPYGQRTILGSVEHLKNPSLAKMYAFYNSYYRPNNMCLALAGDFDRQKMLGILEKYFGSWQAKALPRAQKWDLPKPRGLERDEVFYEAEEKVMISWPTVPTGHRDKDALRVMDMLMDNTNTGIINITLNQAQKVKNAGCSPSFQNDAGDWTLYGIPKKDQTLEQVEELLMGTIKQLKEGHFTRADIQAIITNWEVGDKAALESNGSRVQSMAFSYLTYREWREIAETMDRFRAVTKEDVMRVVNKYVGKDRVVVYRRNGKPELPSMTKPEFTKIEIDSSKESKFFETIVGHPVVPLEPKWLVQDRDYQITEHPWGKLYSTTNPANDLFSLTIQFDVGTARLRKLEPAMSLLRLSGGGELDAEAFEKKLYALGSRMSFGVGDRQSSITLGGLDKNLWPTLELMFSRFLEPNIKEDTLKKLIEVTLGAHEDNKKNPGMVHYALRSYGMRGRKSKVLAQMGEKELRRLRTSALVSILSKVWNYQFRVMYVGNRAPRELAKLLDPEKDRYSKFPSMKPDRYQASKGPRVYFVHRDMVQAQVAVMSPDKTLDPTRAVDYSFFSSYLGGGMSAVIFQEIREARALAYSAGGGYYAGAMKGDQNSLIGSLGTQADKTVEATTLLRELLRNPPLSQERFGETAKSLEESYRTNPVGFRGIPGTVRGWEEKGLPPVDPGPERFKQVQAYTLEDLAAFASQFKDQEMIVCVLGHRDKVDLEGLATLGELVELQLSDIFPY